MYDPRNNNPYGGGQYGRNQQQYGRNPYGRQSQYPPGMAPNGSATNSIQASSLISKVMGLLSIAFIVATIGTYFGAIYIHTSIAYWGTAIGGFVCLIALQALINKQGWNLFLLYLFVLLEGMSIGPLIDMYLRTPTLAPILTEAFLITAVTSVALSLFAWMTKSDFTHIGQFLFVGLIIVIVATLLNVIFFHSTILVLLLTIVGIAIFCGYMLYDVQRAKYMPDTLPSAINITVNLFLNILNLFLLILRLLTILQGGNSRD
jgi:FtsH-binding integral membrane protein